MGRIEEANETIKSQEQEAIEASQKTGQKFPQSDVFGFLEFKGDFLTYPSQFGNLNPARIKWDILKGFSSWKFP